MNVKAGNTHNDMHICPQASKGKDCIVSALLNTLSLMQAKGKIIFKF